MSGSSSIFVISFSPTLSPLLAFWSKFPELEKNPVGNAPLKVPDMLKKIEKCMQHVFYVKFP